MTQLYWNTYKRLEKELIALSESIHFDDQQLGVYSSHIADLLVRTSIEIESLAKTLYYDNGGDKTIQKPHFDTICLKFLNEKWKLEKKHIFVTSAHFYLSDPQNTELTPLRDSDKKGPEASGWEQAYQAVKHDRINNLKQGNLVNLLHALGALYILNIYYRNSNMPSVADKDASNIDWSLGSDVFSVKICSEGPGVPNFKVYEKKEDYDECIYIVKHTDDTALPLIQFLKDFNQQIKDLSYEMVAQGISAKLEQWGQPINGDELTKRLTEYAKEMNSAAFTQIAKQKGQELYNLTIGLKLEAVLNKQQFE